MFASVCNYLKNIHFTILLFHPLVKKGKNTLFCTVFSPFSGLLGNKKEQARGLALWVGI